MKKVLVISVHPDDETLGCGGTLLKLKNQGCDINWCIVTSMSEVAGYTKETIVQRDHEIEKVAELYGFNKVDKLNFKAAELDALDMKTLMTPLIKIIDNLRPDTLFIPFKWDVHSDHRVVFDAVWSCSKPFRSPYIKTILMMETLSETEMAPPIGSNWFSPNSYVDISLFLEKKIKIMKMFESEILPPPFPRSEENIRALARFRGASINCDYAEAFMVLREVW